MGWSGVTLPRVRAGRNPRAERNGQPAAGRPKEPKEPGLPSCVCPGAGAAAPLRLQPVGRAGDGGTPRRDSSWVTCPSSAQLRLRQKWYCCHRYRFS